MSERPYKYKVIASEDGSWILVDNTGQLVWVTPDLMKILVSAYNNAWLFWTDEGEEALWDEAWSDDENQ